MTDYRELARQVMERLKPLTEAQLADITSRYPPRDWYTVENPDDAMMLAKAYPNAEGVIYLNLTGEDTPPLPGVITVVFTYPETPTPRISMTDYDSGESRKRKP